MERIVRVVMLISVIVLAALACGQPAGSGAVVQTPAAGDGTLPESTQPAPGSSRTLPAPVGSVILADGIEFEILGQVRPATEIVASAHPWNRKVESGEEYIFVTLRLRCTKAADEKCALFLVNLKLVGSSGVERDVVWNIANVDDILEQTDLYGGSEIVKQAPFIIDQGETGLVLVYQPPFGDKFYLAVGE